MRIFTRKTKGQKEFESAKKDLLKIRKKVDKQYKKKYKSYEDTLQYHLEEFEKARCVLFAEFLKAIKLDKLVK